MSFNRSNISTSYTFTRNGAVESTSTPNFQVFDTTANQTLFSLGPDWKVETSTGTNAFLDFRYKGSSKLRITDLGVSFDMDKLSLGNRSSAPATVYHSEGDLIKIDGKLFVLQGSNNNNPTE